MDDHGDTLEWGREVLQKVVERFHLNQMELKRDILLVDEIPNNHLGWLKPYK